MNYQYKEDSVFSNTNERHSYYLIENNTNII